MDKENTAWVGDYKKYPGLFAQRCDYCCTVICSAPWIHRTAGYAGAFDGWLDLYNNKKITNEYARAENGTVTLTGEIDFKKTNGDFSLYMGFGNSPAESSHYAATSFLAGDEETEKSYVKKWKDVLSEIQALNIDNEDTGKLYRKSIAVIRAHESSKPSGAIIASLSVPWGNQRDVAGGYHMVWSRDLVEAAGALAASGMTGKVIEVLRYLQVTQETDGHWAQNMWIDGAPFFSGIQLDETALPVLLTDLAWRKEIIDEDTLHKMYPMVRKAVSYIIRNGPVSPEDRWEHDPGYSVFSVSVMIAALCAAADIAEVNEEAESAAYMRTVADTWNENIERWIYVTGTGYDKDAGIEGHYLRIRFEEKAEKSGTELFSESPGHASSDFPSTTIGPDILALVRFGLRTPDDPRIVDTLKLVDKMLKDEFPAGPSWRRYVDDKYGEQEDGAPFDFEARKGKGRSWPLLTGERAHYELAAGRREEAIRLLKAMEYFGGETGLISEQVWNGPSVEKYELYPGKPTGSARPLVWAHAEYVKLCRSIQDNAVFDLPPQTVRRYIMRKTVSPYAIWRPNHKLASIRKGKKLRIETDIPVTVRWSFDKWEHSSEMPAVNTDLDTYYTDLPSSDLQPGQWIVFRFFGSEKAKWDDREYYLAVEDIP